MTVPRGPPPSRLEVKNLQKGTGAVAKRGRELTVNYVGVSYSTGKEFDNSFDRGEPFPFQLGAGMVIPGWDQGLQGMKVGGRRRLTIPAKLGYGAQGQPPTIKPNETLVFVIDLLGVK
ncbi:MAG: FKBP-type peptidyl-prolyl cis-trans isomerase [Thermoleophilaceae bacterium]